MMKPPKAEITIRINPDALETIETGISVSIRELEAISQKSEEQKRRLSLLWDCRNQIDRAIEDKLTEFSLYDQEARQRFEEWDRQYRRKNR